MMNRFKIFTTILYVLSFSFHSRSFSEQADRPPSYFWPCEAYLQLLPELGESLNYAKQKHASQMYGTLPYEFHLRSVLEVGIRFGFKAAMKEAHNFNRGFLSALGFQNTLRALIGHDLLEDTPTTKDELIQKYGHEVADPIWRVTLERAPYRAEAYALTYPKIRASAVATFVKLSDRISNMEMSIRAAHEKNDKKKYLKYQSEWYDFVRELFNLEDTLATPEELAVLNQMWKHLSELHSLPVEQAYALIPDAVKQHPCP